MELEPKKFMIGETSSYYIQYNENLDRHYNNNIINTFGYVSFNYDDSEIDSVDNQIRSILDFCSKIHRIVNYRDEQIDKTYRLIRIYVDINNTIAFNNVKEYINLLFKNRTSVLELSDKLSMISTDISRLLNFKTNDITGFLGTVIDYKFVHHSFDIRYRDGNWGSYIFGTYFHGLEHHKLIINQKKKYLQEIPKIKKEEDKSVEMQILLDSAFLQELTKDEDLQNVLDENSIVKDAYEKSIKIYQGVYDNDLISSINSLSYLGCHEKINELFIILHFSRYKELLLKELNDDLLFQYNSFKMEDTKLNTIIKYDMINLFKELNFRDIDKYTLLKAFHDDNIKIVLYLLSSEIINIHFNNDQIIKDICYYGNIKIAKILFSKGINIHINNDEPFRISCRNGHLKLAKWLYNISKNSEIKINIYSNDSDAIIGASINDHLDVVKWLYDIGGYNRSSLWDNENTRKVFRNDKVNDWLRSIEELPIL